jgi:hypothetical protein
MRDPAFTRFRALPSFREGGRMSSLASKMSFNHPHPFSIADRDTVWELLNKLAKPNGSSHNVDNAKLMQALRAAVRRYTQSDQQIKQAFFHGLLTGYAVGLKHK